MRGGRSSMKRPEVKITDEQNNQFAYQNFQSRARLDARLWLECRLCLVKNMLAKITGMGLTKGTDRPLKHSVLWCKNFCAQTFLFGTDLRGIRTWNIRALLCRQ